MPIAIAVPIPIISSQTPISNLDPSNSNELEHLQRQVIVIYTFFKFGIRLSNFNAPVGKHCINESQLFRSFLESH